MESGWVTAAITSPAGSTITGWISTPPRTRDATAATGCVKCPAGRDLYTGWGTLDVQSALTMQTEVPLPATDHYEPNDDAGPWAHALPPLPRTIDASLDFWDDDTDVYRVHVNKGSRLFARLTTPVSVRLTLWAPGTKRVELTPGNQVVDMRVAGSRRIGGGHTCSLAVASRTSQGAQVGSCGHFSRLMSAPPWK